MYVSCAGLCDTGRHPDGDVDSAWDDKLLRTDAAPQFNVHSAEERCGGANHRWNGAADVLGYKSWELALERTKRGRETATKHCSGGLDQAKTDVFGRAYKWSRQVGSEWRIQFEIRDNMTRQDYMGYDLIQLINWRGVKLQCCGIFCDIQVEELGERWEDHHCVHPPAQ